MVQDWFRKAKLGIFIHWGIYSVEGTSESWAFGSGSMSYVDYMKQLDGFTASNYDAEKWAKLFKKSGAKYAVLTAKHHDGVALFDSKYSDLNVVKKTPAGRDLIAPYCDALRKEGLNVGIYLTNTDWSDIGHLAILTGKTQDEIKELYKTPTSFSSLWWDLMAKEKNLKDEEIVVSEENAKSWENFMNLYKGQIQELLTNYGEIDLLWFDAMIHRRGYSWEQEDVKNMILSINPNIIVNGRLDNYGDYLSSECRLPLAPVSDDVWEYCHTFGESWGYNPNDRYFKDVYQVIRLFTDCISKGGNMLINAGPTQDGQIPPQVEKVMLEMGEWIGKYEDAIFPTNRGIPTNYCSYPTTLSEDRKTLFIFVHDHPNKYIMLNGIRNDFKNITCLTNNRKLSHNITGGAPWVNLPGCVWIDINDEDLDDVCTVIKCEFENEIDLVALNYKGSYGAQTS